MKRSKIALTLGSVFISLSAAHASVPNHDNPTTFLGPTAKGSFTSLSSDSTAFSLSGEAGLKNFRVGGTFGWRINPNQRLKLSAEYLWQDITYPFFSGNTDQWVNQGAIGADYEYLLYAYPFRPILEISGFYSHAPSKSLGTRTGSFVDTFGIAHIFINPRRIAGSNAGGVAPGASIQPWWGSRVGLYLNYDNVRYDTNFGRNQNVNGFGGTARFSQLITDNLVFGGSAAVRQPFNNYAADLALTNIPFYGNWTLDLFGDYTTGKNQLPNSYNVGISADYYFDSCIYTPRANLKGDFKNEMPLPHVVNDDFLQWAADPAVYLPQVLAIPDQEVTLIPPKSDCKLISPTVIGTIAPVILFAHHTTTVNAATIFSPSSGLIYSIVVSPTPTGGSSVTIDPTTGLVTIVGGSSGQLLTATVTATNGCGVAVSSNFRITVRLG